MKLLNKINILVVFLVLLGTAQPAHAVGWWDHFFGRDRDFKPYLQNGTEPHNTQWRRESWQVTDWAPTLGAGYQQLDQFFRADIFTEYKHANPWRSPTLRVGESFYHLSGYDQRRVVELFDYVVGATKHQAGTLYLEDDYTGRTIGLYNASGLTLQ